MASSPCLSWGVVLSVGRSQSITPELTMNLFACGPIETSMILEQELTICLFGWQHTVFSLPALYNSMYNFLAPAIPR